MKVILNKCYGGFGMSHKAYLKYAEKKGFAVYPYKGAQASSGKLGYRKLTPTEAEETTAYYFKKDYGEFVSDGDIDFARDFIYLDTKHRADPVLVEVVEELGEEANARFAALKVVSIPDGMDYIIDDYDGVETLHERVPCW